MRRSPLLALVLSGALLTACSGDSGERVAHVRAVGVVLGSTSGDGELADLSAEAVLEEAKAAFLAAGTVRIVGDITEGPETFSLDLMIAGSEGGRGSVSTGGATFQLVRVGTDVYFQAPASFYEAQSGPEAAADLATKFVKATTEDPNFADLAAFTDLQALADELFSPDGELEKTDVIELDGQQVLGLRDSDGSVLYVAATGDPVPVRIAAVEEGATPAPDATDSGRSTSPTTARRST
jgi:hypothetical protein